MKRQKLLALFCVLALLALAVSGCGGTEETADPAAEGAPAEAGGEDIAEPETPAAATPDPAGGEWVWERKVEIVCPWGAGGGADTTARAFASALEKEIGVPVVVNNKSGAGGATGTDFTIKQPADGYTWMLGTQSLILAQLTGATDVPIYESLTPVVRVVHDVNIIVANKDAPYNDLTELLAYIDANPNEIKAGCMSITGLDGLTVKLTFDGKVEAVAYTEGAQLNADIMGGHMQLGVVGPAEVIGLIQSGDMKCITVCAEERMTSEDFKDVSCTGELGINSFYGPARGIYCANGTPQAAIDAMNAAGMKAMQSAEFQDWCKAQGLDQRPGPLDQAGFQAFWDSEYEGLKALL